MGERRLIQVPIAGIGVVRRPGVLTTLLGSCVGMVVQDLRNGVAVLAHIVRPKGTGAGMGPGYFADVAAPRARDLAIQNGADPRELMVRIAGGGRMVENGVDIGAQNCEAVKEATYALGMVFGGRIKGPSDGGCYVAVDSATGKVALHKLQGRSLDDDAWSKLQKELGVLL
ncbi:MAG: chemotaxis protein CheD [Planctomycetes bacterium]|nr:chemotaxis protein CheD [Planctomycetota bacterium]MCB9884819.1 chemotaxis protein CheD [Planctomycetota bacterium]